MTRHFSTFELDVHFAAGTPEGELAEHVATCTRCAAYLDELRALDAQPHVRIAVPPATPGGKRARGRFLGSAAGVLAIAAAVALYVRGRQAAEEPYVGVKGAPAVQVLVRGNDGTRIWDGHSPVHPGNAIALHVACEQLTQFTVVDDSPEHGRFSEGVCPKTPMTLPFTLVVDDQPGHERFIVVLSRAHLDDPTLRQYVRSGTRDQDVWVTAFDFPKAER